MDSVHLRQYQDSDNEAVWKLHVDGLNQTGSFIGNQALDADFTKIKEIYLDNGGEFLIASVTNIVVGMGALKKVDGKTAEIKRMRVNIGYQKQGIGALILDHLIERAKEFGYRRLILDTSRKQLAAQRLYEKRGFRLYKEGAPTHPNTLYYEREL